MVKQVGIIGRDNKKGLGTLTWGYVKHLPITRVLCLGDVGEKRYAKGWYYRHMTDGLADRFLTGLDAVILLETAFPNVLTLAKQKGVKTLLKVNYEYLPEKHVAPDVYLCSSSLNYESVAGNKKLLPDPVDTDEVTFRLRKKAKTFVHTTGKTIGDANGTNEVIEAIKKVKSDVRFIIYSFADLKVNDPRVEVRKPTDNYYELFTEGDVFLSPQKFRATSLPIQEAMASGMPVLTTNIKPFNEFCQFLSNVSEYKTVELLRKAQSAVIDTNVLAEKIDEVANTDITTKSKQAYKYAQSISWKSLKKSYEQTIFNA